MTSRLRRSLSDPQTPVDDAIGGLLTGVAIVLIFRFAFGDSWAVALGAAAVVAVLTALYTAWRRRRKATRGA